MAQSFSVEAILKATDKNFSKVFGEADKNAQGFKGKVSNAMKTTGKVIAGASAVAVGAGTAAFAATNKVTQGFDDIAKNSTKLGVSTDAYQEMDYWASQNGISTGTMERAVGRLNQRIGRAADGNEKYSSALENLGINMDDVREGTLSTEDAMTQSIQALSEMSSEQEKSAAASELFGTKLARDLMPALQDGSMSFEEAKEAAEELGIVIGEDSINAGVEFQNNMTDMKASLGAITQNIIGELIPVFNNMLEWILENLPAIRDTFSNVFGVIREVFGFVIERIGVFIGWLQTLFESNSETFTGIRDTIVDVFTTIIEFFQETWANIQALWEEHGETLFANAQRIFMSIWGVIETAFNLIYGIITQIIGYVVPFIQEKLGQLQDFWLEHGETISKAVENVFNFIKGIIEFIMPIVTSIIEGAWGIITAVFDAAIGIIMGLVQFLASLLTGDFEGIKESLIGIWESLWQGIKDIVGGAWDLLAGVFETLWGQISEWFGELPGQAVEWGKGLISGFIDGIRSMFGDIGQAASDAVSAAADFLKFWSPAKKGEGRFIEDWGENMIDGFLDGVKSEAKEAGKVMDDVIAGMQPSATQFDVSSQIHGLHRQSQGRMNYDYRNELTVGKEPAYINVRIGNSEFNAFVDDISNNQNRKAFRKRRNPR